MLLDRAAGLTEKISRYGKLKAAAAQAQTFKTRAVQFEQVRSKLSETRKVIRQFDAIAIPLDFQATNASQLLSNATTLRDRFVADPGVIGVPPFDLKFEFVDRIVGLSDFANATLEKTWRSYVESRASIGSSEVLDALMRLPQFRTSVLAIRECIQQIDRIAAKVPDDLQLAVVNLDGFVQELRSAWAKISANDIPEPVIAFLRASAADGVPLDMLQEETRKWLAEKGLLSAFRIRIG
jgi:hypothetical protein